MNAQLIVRWFARLWGLASTALLLAFMFGGEESMRPTAREAIALLCFPVGVMLGFAIAWRREGLGGAVSVVSLALFYVWMFVLNGKIPLTPYFLLFAGPGFLHLGNAVAGALRLQRAG